MSSTVEEMAGYVREAVDVNRSRGLADAWHMAGRMLGISARRARAYWHNEVARVGADELDGARRWHADHCRKEAERLTHQALLLRARSEQAREKLNAVKSLGLSRVASGGGSDPRG